MADTIVMVSSKVEAFLNPVKKGNFGVRVMAANKEDEGMHPHQQIDKPGKGKFFIGEPKKNNARNNRKYL